MAKKSDVFNVAGVDTVIGTGVRLRGNLSAEGDVTIDGHLVGNVKSGGHVTIGVNAQMTGDISGTAATVAGRLEGNVKAQDSASVTSTGQVHGDITCTALEVQMGGIFIGISKMKREEATEVLDRTEVEGPKR